MRIAWAVLGLRKKKKGRSRKLGLFIILFLIAYNQNVPHQGAIDIISYCIDKASCSL
jgi:hypothetical protein